MRNPEKIILLFDGVCNLCNASVNFVIRHDRKDNFRFASLQSDTGIKLAKKYGIELSEINSVVVIEEGKVYLRSDASLRIVKNLSGAWKFFYVFSIIPRWLRDPVYDFISRNRYRWFGKRESCMMPDENIRQKFIVNHDGI